MRTHKPSHSENCVFRTHSACGRLGWCRAMLGGRRRRRRLHLCREVGCLAATSDAPPSIRLIYPSVQHLPSPPLPPLLPPVFSANTSTTPPFMGGTEVRTAVVWYSGRMEPICLLGCTHRLWQLDRTSQAAARWQSSFYFRRLTGSSFWGPSKQGNKVNTQRTTKSLWSNRLIIPHCRAHRQWMD